MTRENIRRAAIALAAINTIAITYWIYAGATSATGIAAFALAFACIGTAWELTE
ncbi:MAG: hypothetical protein IVW53_14610 [Chloroflexi bacterium]|nr:hypothetical protein [Chloroflexota bacterium]